MPGGRPPTGHAIGLLDERDRNMFAVRDLGHSDKIRRPDPPTGTVTEHEQRQGMIDGCEMDPRDAERG